MTLTRSLLEELIMAKTKMNHGEYALSFDLIFYYVAI